MNPLTKALFSAWEWRLDVLLVFALFVSLYLRGWLRLRARHARALASRLRLAAHLCGVGVLAVSLLSPLDQLGGQLFFMHMAQHLLTMMVAAPLLWLAEPFPIMLWGAPDPLRHWVGAALAPAAPLRMIAQKVTQPAISWLLFITIYLGWHEPVLYNLALRRDWIHDLQHITFFAVAMLYWWHVVGAGPQLHSGFPVWGKLAFLIGTIPLNMAAGVMISFSSTILFTYYESVPRVWGFSTQQDQMIGGILMWIPGSMMFLLAALIVLARQFQRQTRFDSSDVVDWDNPAALTTPAIGPPSTKL